MRGIAVNIWCQYNAELMQASSGPEYDCYQMLDYDVISAWAKLKQCHCHEQQVKVSFYLLKYLKTIDFLTFAVP